MNWFKKLKPKYQWTIFAFLLASWLAFGLSGEIADASRYLVGGQTFGERYPGVSPQNLVLWLNQSDVRSYGDSQTWNDISGLRNNVDQTTGANQADPYATYRDFNGTTDFIQQVEVDDETGVTFWPTYPGLTTTATAAKIRLQGLDLAALYATASGNSTHRLVLKDSAGAIIVWGYIRGADSAEALGAELVQGPGMEAGAGNPVIPTGWDNYGQDAGESSVIDAVDFHGGAASYDLNVDAGSEGIEQWSSITITAGKTYKISAWLKRYSGTLRVSTYNGDGSNGYVGSYAAGYAAWTELVYYWTATASGATGGIAIYMEGAGRWKIDDVSMKEVTAFGTDGVLIGNTIAGAAQTWTGTGAGNPNDPSTLEVYKVMGDLTGDFTLSAWIKPVDGQPAAINPIITRWGTNTHRSIALYLDITGKIDLLVSVDGSSSRYLRTDAAAFTNGAQASFKHVVATYNDTTHLGAIYINGALVASTQNGGAFAGVYDCDRPLEVGADSQNSLYLAGQIADVKIFNRALSAAEIQQIYLTDYMRYAIAWWRLVLPFALVFTLFLLALFVTRRLHGTV